MTARLLLAGGLGALQTAALLAALPFTFIMLLIAFGQVLRTHPVSRVLSVE